MEQYPLIVFRKTAEMDSWPMETHPKGYTGEWQKLVNGEIYSINNRGLTTAILANLKDVVVRWATKQEIIEFSYQYDTPNQGTSVTIRETGQVVPISGR